MGVNTIFKRTLISTAITLGFATAGTVNAADWLLLQGTEPAAASVPAHVFGFVQAGFMKDYSSANATGNVYVPPKMLGPNLNAQSGFNVSHAQVGVRGTGFPLDDHINYFMLLEAGNTGLNNTSTGKSGPVLTDASVTPASVSDCSRLPVPMRPCRARLQRPIWISLKSPISCC
jgi:hypothetical protein